MVLIFANTKNLGFAIFILVIFSSFVQAAEGATYGIVPYVEIGTGYSFGQMTLRTDILVGAGTTIPSTTPSAFDLVISSPTQGTYSHNEITITGTAPSTDLFIQFFDNDAPLGETEVENDQSFSYHTDELIDGSHTLLALALDNEDTIQYTSEEVTFEIDTTPPEVEDIEISPESGIKTGEILEITVTSEPNVFQGAVVFNVDIAELENLKLPMGLKIERDRYSKIDKTLKELL